MDLPGGRYPNYNPNWILQGQPAAPLVQNMSVFDVNTGAAGAALTSGTGVMSVFPVVVQPGDVLTGFDLILATAAGTQTNAFVAVYSGILAASTLIYQSTAEGSSADSAGTLTYSLGTGATTPTGGIYAPAAGLPVVIGVGLCWTASTMPKWDGTLGGSGAIAYSELQPVYTCGSALGGTAPSTLSGIAAGKGPVPRIVFAKK